MDLDLDLLCDGIELEDYKDEKREEVRLMNEAMDARLRQIQNSKVKPVAKPKKEADENDVEEQSKILMRPGSRKLKAAELENAVRHRTY